ncbi:hypothetical protein CAL13_10165 [Bordetella genomosp. 9]|uniref:Uncharacterized protein n=1 Tax=Bordetella genomosp. 9 TaxID=1416803 RepID=A0A1W6YZN0_9BORD|nr:hypothetical protein CAL13_10165 [Bordetella genomosp. 9]
MDEVNIVVCRPRKRQRQELGNARGSTQIPHGAARRGNAGASAGVMHAPRHARTASCAEIAGAALRRDASPARVSAVSR